MSATRSSFASNDSVAKHNPSRRVTFDDEMSKDFDTWEPYYPRYSTPSQRAAASASLKRGTSDDDIISEDFDSPEPYSPRYSPPPEQAAAPASRKRRTTPIKTQVPPQHEPPASEADAGKAAAMILQRVKTAAARANHNAGIVLQTKNALLKLKSLKTRAIGKAAKWEHAKHLASQALELARADKSAAKRRADGCSYPRRMFQYIMARLEDEPLLDVEEATRVVAKAGRAYSFAKAETLAAREAVDSIARGERATELLLRNAELAHARVVKTFHALETAAVEAKGRAVYAATAVEMARCWTTEVYASGRGDKMDPLPVAAELAAGVRDGFIDDQVAPKAKRFKR